MIILRYLTKEILVTTVVIALVLFLLSFGNRFAQYLEEAWQGRIAAEVLFTVLAYRVPQFLMINLPISFFIAILLSYGRLYADNEIVVLSSCGVSKCRLLIYTLIPAAVVSAVVAVLTLYLGPLGQAKAEAIQLDQKSRSDLSFLTPNRLQPLGGQSAEIYFEKFSNDDRTTIESVIIAEMSSNTSKNSRVAIITAASGREEIVAATGERFLKLEDVYQYEGEPGLPDYLVQYSETYRFLLDLPAQRLRSQSRDSVSTIELMRSDRPESKAELQWRIALPLVVLIATLMAVPLSYTSPRQGRFFKLFPALALIIFYMGLLSVGKTKMEDGEANIQLGLWWVHSIFLGIAAGLLLWNNNQYRGLWRHKGISGIGQSNSEVSLASFDSSFSRNADVEDDDEKN